MADKQTDSMPKRAPTEPGAFEEQIQQEPPNVAAAAEPAAEDVGGAGEAGEGAEAEAARIEEDLEALQRQFSTLSDRHLRLAAEFDNYRKRVERERSDATARAQAELAGRLLDALDDLERVTAHADDRTEDALLQGVQLVERKLRQALAAAGLEQVDAAGARFDPNAMEAVAMVAADSHEDDDIVNDVFQHGYTFRGILLRPARVRVRKHGL